MGVPFYIRVALVFYAFVEFFRHEKKFFRYEKKGWRHMDHFLGRPVKMYGKAIQIGANVYTLYYRIWFKPFHVRDWPIFDAFVDPMAGQAIFLDLRTHNLINPKNNKEIPIEEVFKMKNWGELSSKLN